MSEELYDDGFRNQINVDFSSVAIKQMQERYQSNVGMQCMLIVLICLYECVVKTMDIREMDFPDSTFGAVLDKGTMDSILCAEGSLMLAAKCLSEISRVLEPNGVFVCMSHGHPNIRMQVFDKPEYGWRVSVHNVAKPMLKFMKPATNEEEENEENSFHYVYVCQCENNM